MARSFRIVQVVLMIAKVQLQKVCVCVCVLCIVCVRVLKSLFHE